MPYILFTLTCVASFAGFAAICASMLRHGAQVFGRDLPPSSVTLLRVSATLLLVIAWAACVGRWGVAMGTVACVCVFPVAATAVVLCLTYWPRRSLHLGGIVATVVSLLLAMFLLIHQSAA